ncbi:MAG TPA: MBL fold metallo-hydrolase [Dehalococcoidia bacterium]|nr:MBL fold metallo-hydrolase [Dehalococcoidia bacterium]
MNSIAYRLVSLTLAIGFLLLACVPQRSKPGPGLPVEQKGAEGRVILTILYDNNRYDRRLTAAWGFACLVNLRHKVVLFDTGGDGAVLLHNMEKLKINPEEIGVVVLSHVHGDHVGGLARFLEWNSRVAVYMPASFPQQMKQAVIAAGANLEEVDEAQELFGGVFTTGELDGGIREQSLVLRTPKGLVVITGCAHPGIVKIAKKAKDIARGEVYLLVGGFHLAGASTSHVVRIVESLRQFGVVKVAPCHCSGAVARRLFEECFGDDYIDCGVGKRIVVE